MLMLQAGMLGVFISLDFFLFYVFWEVMLVPMYFLIGVWGGPRKLYAAIKFFLYTLVGSVLLLLGILALYFAVSRNRCGSSGRSRRSSARCPHSMFWRSRRSVRTCRRTFQYWVFLAFFVGFAIKVPMFPFHTWLPDAHVEAPDRRIGHSGRRPAEDGDVWIPAIQPSDSSLRRAFTSFP